MPEGWNAPRRLSVADAAQATAVIHAAFAAQPVQTDPPSGALRETAASLAAHLASHGGAGVEDRAGALIGIVLWAEKAGGLYLGRLAVRPGWRGQGIARALIAAAEEEARNRHLSDLRLSVRLGLVDNQRLFSCCGFVEFGRTSHPGYAEPTSMEMRKSLR